MQFLVGTVTRCAGTNHYTVPITVTGVGTFTLRTTVQEFQNAAPNGFEEAKDAVVSRLRSALLEASAVTFAQVKLALEGKTFSV